MQPFLSIIFLLLSTVGKDKGSLNGKRERTVPGREGVPMAASQLSVWPIAARTLPIKI